MGDLRKRAIFVKCWILEEKMRDFRLNGGFPKRKRVIFWCHGGFEKTRDFLVKWGILEGKTHDFLVKWGILEQKNA